jgi:hypothetical protein
MNAFVTRALAATGAVIAVAGWSSSALAEDVYGSQGPRATHGAPMRDVITYQEKEPNSALIGSGALMFGLSYGGSVFAAAISDRPSDNHLYIPVVGPWMDLTNRGNDCAGIERCGVNETANKVLLATDGIFQAAGVLQIIGGFLAPETRTVTRTAKPGVHFSPTGGMGSVGLSAYGAF